jgi:hypothetical protein
MSGYLYYYKCGCTPPARVRTTLFHCGLRFRLTALAIGGAGGITGVMGGGKGQRYKGAMKPLLMTIIGVSSPSLGPLG